MQPEKRISTDAMSPRGPGRFVLGLGGTLDYEITWDGALVERLAREWGIRRDECDPSSPIVDERSLLAVILGFAAERRGGERYVESVETIRRFASRHRTRVTLGGTCVRAALMMHALGIRSTVHLVSVDDDFRRLFPADCDYISSAQAEGMFPHLIVQLPRRGTVSLIDGEITVDRANRMIFANDPPHRSMALSPELGNVLAGAEVFLVSGFNVMTDPTLLSRRLSELQAAMSALPRGSLVIYEDAGYHTEGMSEAARGALAPLVDVFSMNEDEMQAHLRRSVDLMDPSDVAAALVELRSLIPRATLVVHTQHWAMASGDSAVLLRAALRRGAAAATARYAYGDTVTARQIEAVERLEPTDAGRAFASMLSESAAEPTVCIPVVAVQSDDPTTVGLGDSFVGGFMSMLGAAHAAGKRREDR
jgi:sugar/nucleoside kinase (ribokinase family)